jgi:hypothetical protein
MFEFVTADRIMSVVMALDVLCAFIAFLHGWYCERRDARQEAAIPVACVYVPEPDPADLCRLADDGCPHHGD